jgi:uncharacterized flavoprotein (TIGR03862 family)
MKKSVSIVGGGPAALFLAAFLDPDLFDVTIFEKNKTPGRKFLVAGKGGFNLTHAEPMDTFINRYSPVSFLEQALLSFDNNNLRQWLKEIGIPTFIGSSKRVYPVKGIKPIEVLNAILAVLKHRKVNFLFQHKWTGWDKENDLVFNSNFTVKTDYCVFALGGASWKKTGSDGSWLTSFAKKGVSTIPFQSANCAFKIDWSKDFLLKNEGKPLKNISLSCGSSTQKGELVITQFGLEGNAIYALSSEIQKGITNNSKSIIYLDLKPALSIREIKKRLSSSREKNTTIKLRNDLKLSNVQINLLKSLLLKEEFLSIETLINRIKKLDLVVTGAAPIDEAISTTGGIDLKNLDKNFELIKMKNTFCIGEMLDWNAPTGGYLLQACTSMGVFLARHLNGSNNINDGK